MIVNNREIIFRNRYLEDLIKIRTFLDEYDSKYADEFVKESLDFIVNKVASYPESNPEYKYKRTKTKRYRRAIYRKNYYIIYKLTSKKIEILTIFHHKRDPKNVKL